MPQRLLSLVALCLGVLLSACASATEPATGVVPIGQVQGRGTVSELAGIEVIVEGVVSADFRDGLGGVFVQDGGDGDGATSDAVFVSAAPGTGSELEAGRRVRVHGRVVELGAGGTSSMTAIEPSRLDALGGGTAEPLALTAAPADWEPLEGMQVRIDATLTLSGSGELARFGELTASFGGRLWQPTEIAAPGSEAFARVLADNARRQLLLDDGSSERDPARVAYMDGAATPRSESLIRSVEGIVDQRHGSYRLQVTGTLDLEQAPRPAAPDVVGTLRVAVLNLENLFNGDGRGSGFPTPRGAETPQQLRAQTARLVTTIRALDADIAALMELENDGYGPHSSLAQLVDALNVGGGDWRFVDVGHGPGGDEIRVGLIYRNGRVSPLGKAAVLEGGPFGERSRVPLAQAFRRLEGDPFVVVANHFKSKGCSDANGPDADQHDGQGCWNALRTESARRLDAWMETDPTGAGTPLQLLVGDFNAYAMEDPMRALREAGWVDALAAAGVERSYSYVYDGLSGRLDHALLSPALATRLRGAAEWHSNADEPADQGYAQAGDRPGPWRSSDHDPLLLGFDL